ncbi:hypothetical protein [Flavobacterium zepuense]|nr:hypothetical protein [Flavobacterium zepuense]
MNRPLIFDYKTIRQGDGNGVAFQYDDDASLNMITINGVKQKFIESESSAVQLETKTKVHQEQDDDNFLLELSTKTLTKVERDDERFSLLDLDTKTLIKQERDDEHFNYYQ